MYYLILLPRSTGKVTPLGKLRQTIDALVHDVLFLQGPYSNVISFLTFLGCLGTLLGKIIVICDIKLKS